MKIEDEINAGIACSDRTNEVEPRPNKDDMSVERWNNLLILTCHPYVGAYRIRPYVPVPSINPQRDNEKSK
ncbi:MAG: hypothetical protein LBG80_01515 [Bacteroidales bacterium]|nr:hypothetical protein [Bacteroidales bacterium]